MWKCLNQRLCHQRFVGKIICKMQLNITGRYLTFIKCSCVCVMWWLIHWFHNMTLLTWTHILASNKAESSLFPPRSLSFSSHRFNFPFLLHLSAPSSHLSINSRLRRFIFSSPRLHFLSFISFPLMHIGGMTPHACTNIHMNAKWLKAEMYTVRELIFRVNRAHTRCIFFFRLKLWIASRPEMKTHYIGHFSHSLASRPFHPRVLTVLRHP